MGAYVLLWLACAAALFARRPDLLTSPQLYAEDGVIFFVQGLTKGVASLFSAHAGYHHVLAHVIAVAALALPVAYQPAAYAWTTLALEAACCALLAPLLRSAIPDGVIRAMLAVAVAAVVPANEIIGSVANLQWYLALPMLAATLVPMSGAAAWAARVAAVIVGITTPQGLVAAPIAAWLWRSRMPGRDPWVATLYAAASLLNVLTAPREPGGHPTSPLLEALFTVPAFRVADMLLLGKSAAVYLASTPILGVIAGLASIAAALLGIARVRGAAPAWTMAYVILAPVVLALLTRPFVGTSFSSYGFFGADRYFVLPCAGLVVVLVMLASAAPRPALARASASALLLAGIVLDFREPGVPANDQWGTYVPRVSTWIAERNKGGPTEQTSVPIPPERWQLVLPACGIGARGGAFPRCP